MRSAFMALFILASTASSDAGNAVTVGFADAAFDVERPFPGGAATQVGEDQLFLSEPFRFRRPVVLQPFEFLNLKTLFKTFEIRLADDIGGGNDESIHIQIEGNFKSFEYIFEYFDETGAKKQAKRDRFTSPTGTSSATISEKVQLKPNDGLFGMSDDTIVRGYEVVILNRDSSEMRIDAIRLGVGANSVAGSDIPFSPIPLPAAGLMLAAVVAVFGGLAAVSRLRLG